MKDVLFGIAAIALFLLASSMDLADAEREDAALAAHWAEIKTSHNTGTNYEINTDHN
jgi:hypothetical protein